MRLIKDENLIRLFDLYQNMLSDTQKDFLTDFINADLTISEIAQNFNISRQAVNDAIKKGIAKMQKLEATLGALARITKLENEICELKGGAK